VKKEFVPFLPPARLAVISTAPRMRKRKVRIICAVFFVAVGAGLFLSRTMRPQYTLRIGPGQPLPQAGSKAVSFFVTNTEARPILLCALRIETNSGNRWTTAKRFSFAPVLENGVLVTNVPSLLNPGEVRRVVVDKPQRGKWRLRMEYGLERSEISTISARVGQSITSGRLDRSGSREFVMSGDAVSPASTD
jgi:hypothetical protein